MFEPQSSIFIHGLEGTSQGAKATLLRELFPAMSIPDFRGSLDERMTSLYQVMGAEKTWTVIGSSFGGLMGAFFALKRPTQVRKLVLLAPALVWPDFATWVEGLSPPQPVNMPVTVYHGSRDEIIPLALTRDLASRVFNNLAFITVDDDHGLYQTAHRIDWHTLLSDQATRPPG